MAGIFGPDAELVRQAIDQQNQAQDMSWANVSPGRGAVAGMAMAGRQLGNAIQGAAGYEDPQVKKAKLMEEAKMEVDQSGADLMSDPKSYYTAAFQALQKRGLTDEAMGVRQILLQEEAQAAENMKNMRDTSKGYGSAGNMIYSKDTGEYTPMEGYQGKGDSEKTITMSPPGSTTKGSGQEKTVRVGSEEYNKLIDGGWIDTSKIPAPPNQGQTIEAKFEYKNMEDQYKSRNELAAEQAKPVFDKARQSADVARQVAGLRTQLETGNFDSGFASGIRGYLATAAQYLGVSDQKLSDMRNNPNDYGILSSVTQNLVAAQATMLQDSGQLSKAELELYKASGANISQTAAGMYVVNEINGAIAEWNIRRGTKLAELYAKQPEAGTNDMQVISEIMKWEQENPLTINKATLDRMKRHASIVEKGKTAKEITSTWSPEKNKNSAIVGNLYKYRGGLYVYHGDTTIDGKLVPDLRPAK